MAVDPREERGAQYLKMIDALEAQFAPTFEGAARAVAQTYVTALRRAPDSALVTQGELNVLRSLWLAQAARLVPPLLAAYETGYAAAFGKQPSQAQKDDFQEGMQAQFVKIADTLVGDATEKLRIKGRSGLIEALSAQ